MGVAYFFYLYFALAHNIMQHPSNYVSIITGAARITMTMGTEIRTETGTETEIETETEVIGREVIGREVIGTEEIGTERGPLVMRGGVTETESTGETEEEIGIKTGRGIETGTEIEIRTGGKGLVAGKCSVNGHLYSETTCIQRLPLLRDHLY